MKDSRALLALVVAMDRKENLADTPSAESAGTYSSDAALQGADDVEVRAQRGPRRFIPFFPDSRRSRTRASGTRFLERMKTSVAFLKARLAHVRNGKLLLDGTEPGPGRIDAFGAARNLLF